FWGQMIVGALALLAVMLGVFRGVSGAFALGVTAIVSVMISPYAYDYDLPLVGIGLALAGPGLVRIASTRERSVLYGGVLLAGAYGLLLSRRTADQHATLAVGGFALMAMLALLLRLLLRSEAPAPLPSAAC